LIKLYSKEEHKLELNDDVIVDFIEEQKGGLEKNNGNKMNDYYYYKYLKYKSKCCQYKLKLFEDS